MSQIGSSQSIPPLFTIEQTELIRRLRCSGVTKEQLVYAFDSFERLERDLSVPQNSNAQSPLNQLSPLTPVSNGLSTQPTFAVTTQNGSINLSSCNFSHQRMKMMELGLMPSTPIGQKRPYSAMDESMESNYDNYMGSDPRFMIMTPEKPHRMMLEAEVNCELMAELNEFAKKGEDVIFAEIRDYVHKHGVKQHQLAVFCGLSQSYVSRYLRGDFHDIAEKSKRSIHRWYLVVKKNPAALVLTLNTTFTRRPSLPTMSPIVSSQMPLNMSSMDLSMDYIMAASQRRERFVFRQAHLEILEKHFKADNYPSYTKRDEIAKECNSVVEATTDGRPLCEREVVNVQVVTNWYANKRKELKKIAKEEGLDNIIAQMRSRGRPCHARVDANPNPFSGIEDLTSSHNYQHHHNQILLQTQQIEHLKRQILQQHQLMQQQIDEEDRNQMGNSDESSNDQNYLPDAEIDEEADAEQLSLAVEVAAVNSAILELSGVHNLSNIKQEMSMSQSLASQTP